jgi:quercetin dioxygenase-like cupin family protein
MTGAAADPLPAAPDGRRASVIHEAGKPMRPFPTAIGGATFREPIDESTDCHQLIQRVIALEPNTTTAELQNEASEDVLYLVQGALRVDAGGEAKDMKSGAALYVPPGTGYHLAAGGAPGVVVSVLSPQPARNPEQGRGGAERGVGRGLAARSTAAPRRGGAPSVAMTSEEDNAPLPAGGDRYFKVLIDPRFGCRNVTQFVGFIQRSRAPFHTHTYEEVIYILDGEGIVHIDDRRVPIRRGTSVFLPPGVPHCLENASADTLKLLGVFSPAGSPADHMDTAGSGD